MAKSDEGEQVAALRVWMEEPNLSMSYERRGAVLVTVQCRRELASSSVGWLRNHLQDVAGDPSVAATAEGLETAAEIVTMISEVLAGSDPQIMPLTGSGRSKLDVLFGKPS